MKKITIFLSVVGVSLIGLFLVFSWYLADYQSGRASFEGVMGQMMGSGANYGMTLAMPEGVWVVLMGVISVTVIGVVGLGYYLAYPEIPTSTVPPMNPPISAPHSEPEMSWAVLMRTSKPEEKKVLEVLAMHGGSYLQKFVVKETGLSKLKTHRIVSRLAERGVVTVEKSGNTNQVSLPPWVKDSVKPPVAVSSSP